MIWWLYLYDTSYHPYIINSAAEQRSGGIRILCPVCIKKLKQNLKFDTKSRFEELAQVCDELGFNDEAKIYRSII